MSQSFQDPSSSATSTPEPPAPSSANQTPATNSKSNTSDSGSSPAGATTVAGGAGSNTTGVPSGGKTGSPVIKTKTKTEILEQRRLLHLPVSSPDFKIGNVNIIVIKQGPLHKTKLLENGKKQRKNWNVAHLVLTETFLLFFKDAKTFAQLQSGTSKPDFCIDLKGATVDWCSADKSKRSNVFEVNIYILGIYFLTTSQRYTYRVLQTIQMKLLLLFVWAERAVLGRI